MRKSKESIKILILTALISTISVTSLISNTVNAATLNPKKAELTAGKVNDEEQVIEKIRLMWKDDLTGGKDIDLDNPVISKKITGYVNQTKKFLQTMNEDKSKDWLWEEYKDYKENPARITSMFNNIVSMAKAYSLPNDTYYQNEELRDKIIYALEWINENAYNEKIEQYGNWWDWMIGIPARLNDVVVLMYDDLSKEQIDKYMSAIQKFLPSIEPGSRHHTGANLADVCLNKLLQGVNQKDSSKIKEASEDIVSVFNYVTSDDGFYPDGSYVQHGIVAYTGSYGNVLINKVSNLMFLLENTPWSIKSDNKNNIYKWIFESFDPIIYKGYVMDMVRGRSISRPKDNGYIQAAGIMEGMLKLSMISDKETSQRIQSLVKEWAQESSSVIDPGSRFKSINAINKFYKIMKDDNVVASKQGENHYALNMMDKTVHERSDYSLAISRSSNRISKYEFMNKENLRPWFQGDGMTYLYNNDLTQFSEDFWPTVDPYRMPGTTVDSKKRADKEIIPGVDPGAIEQDKVYYELTNESWSGGSKLGKYGVAGMKISNKNDSLTANKAWFMFDNEIVCLGSGITNPDEFDTETIIENRKIKKDGTNKFIVDGQEKVSNLGDKGEIKNAKWAYLQGNAEGSDIGYYFPNGEDINILRDRREGNWLDINSGTSSLDKEVKNNYLTMYIDHGKNIKNEEYSYVLLPNKSKDEVEKYSKDSKVKILRNDEKASGVKHTGLNIEGANFWVDGKNTSGDITSNKKASVIMKEDNNKNLTISVSDPTFEGNKISIEINKGGENIVSKDDRISNVKFKDGKITFDVDVKDSKGTTSELVVKLKDGNSKPEIENLNEIPEIYGENIKLNKGDKWDKALHKLSAKDKEDGDITDKILIEKNNLPLDKNSVVDKPGKYNVVFSVTDSKGGKKEKTLEVEVLEKESKPQNDEKDKNNISGDKLPNTGLTAEALGLVLTGGGLFGSGLYFLKKRKNKI
ncbi:polysaccharide lyase family 8 super-sandwich domain-containing protein [Clostridium sardiniense]|uniref:polysaccharide lyase family 8 super-sandwich domain-containing protein n=1 Tax=Clostridium sardiniense TaxID=29369 RepID=UPI003D32F214